MDTEAANTIRLASAHGVTKLCIETDSFETVRLWSRKETQRLVLTPVLIEMYDLILQFSKFVFRLVEYVILLPMSCQTSVWRTWDDGVVL